MGRTIRLRHGEGRRKMKKNSDRPAEIFPLTDSLQPLKDHFNAHRGKLRFMAVISPTCCYCVEGTEAMKQAIMERFSTADMSIALVWIDGVEEDDLDAARHRAKTIDDPRSRHFHDPNRLAGKAIATVLGGEGKIAWDIYLFFDPASTWTHRPPMPLHYLHQLDPESVKWADPAHYHTGDDLIDQLNQVMRRLTAGGA